MLGVALEQASVSLGVRPGLRAVLALVAAAAGCGVLLLIGVRGLDRSLGALDHQPGLLVDFGIYLEQVRALYREPFRLQPHWLYPPLSAALLLGFALLSNATARVVWGGLELLCCAWLALACARQLPSLPKPLRYAAGFGLTAGSLPVLHCVKWGQLSLLVLLLSVLALERQSKSSAWLLGAAAALKVYPLLYAIGRFARGDWRFGLRLALATCVLGVGVPLLLLGPLVTLLMLARVYQLSLNEWGGALSVSHHTLSALIERCFAARGELAGARGPLLLALPNGLRACVSWGCRLALICFTLYRTRKLNVCHPLAYCSVLLCVTLLVRPGWVHYFVVMPLALAVLLEHSEQRSLPLACWTLGFSCSSVGLFVSLANPEWYWVVIRAGLVPLSALATCFGLWACAARSDSLL
jgi:hypothetical protein